MIASWAEGSSSPTSAISLALNVSDNLRALDWIRIIAGPVNFRNNFSQIGTWDECTRSPINVRRLHVIRRCHTRPMTLTVSVDLISRRNSLSYIREGIRDGIWSLKGIEARRWGWGAVALIVYANRWLDVKHYLHWRPTLGGRYILRLVLVELLEQSLFLIMQLHPDQWALCSPKTGTTWINRDNDVERTWLPIILGRGDSMGPVHATSAFLWTTIQSIRPSRRTIANESRFVFVEIVTDIGVLQVIYFQ